MVLRVSMQNKFQFRMTPDFRSLFFQPRGDLHYIGGSDVLPAPLSIEEERECVKALEEEEIGRAHV